MIGTTRQIRVVLDTQRLAAYGLTPAAVAGQLQSANTRADVGSFAATTGSSRLRLASSSRVRKITASRSRVHSGRPVYLRDVVEKLEDGPAEPDSYVMFANARAYGPDGRRGVSRSYDHACQAQRHERHDHLRTCSGEGQLAARYVLPNDLNITVTRNYGRRERQVE